MNTIRQRSATSPTHAGGAPLVSGSTEVSSMPQAKPVVFVVDDDVSVRESLELLIEHAGWQPELFSSAQEFLSHRPPAGAPCCLVLDVNLPGLDGLELQRQLGNRNDVPIVFITGFGDVPMTVKAMKAGALEFLTKPFSDDVLLKAIQGAIDRSRFALRLDAEMRVLRDRYESLTPRERQVMALVVSGRLNKLIAADLGITEITVKAHRGEVMRKMKVRSLAELVMTAGSLGVGPSPNH